MYVTSGFWITFISPCLPVPGEPRGPMRQYVPIIFRLILFHSLARSAKALFRPLSMDHGLPSTAISPKSFVWPCTHARNLIHIRVYACIKDYERIRTYGRVVSGQLLANSNSRFAMVTALPVVDLPAITPVGHFISERCLGQIGRAHV